MAEENNLQLGQGQETGGTLRKDVNIKESQEDIQARKPMGHNLENPEASSGQESVFREASEQVPGTWRQMLLQEDVTSL